MTRQEVIEHLANIGGFDTSYSYGNMKACIEQVFDEFENQNTINRVEVIGKDGRDFVKLLENGHYEISMQDDGKTIKLFEKALISKVVCVTIDISCGTLYNCGTRLW